MASNSDKAEWVIELITPDDAGLEFYINEYKPFRLQALQCDPGAFGSNYARELAFTDDDWRKRLTNPIAKTFVAVRLRDRRILSAASIFGPMPTSEPLSNPNAVVPTKANDIRLEREQRPLYFQLTGVYTRAEARAQGLARAVTKSAIERAIEEARRQGREYRVAVDVYASNTVAIAFYEKSGFIAGGSRPVDADSDPSRPELLMYYCQPSPPQ